MVYVEYYALFGKDGADHIIKKLKGRAKNMKSIFPNQGKGLDNYEELTIYKGKNNS